MDAPALPFKAYAIFHARLYASSIQVFEPSPLIGGCRCTASPRQNLLTLVKGRLEVEGFVGIHIVLGIVLSHNLIDVPLRHP